MTTGQTYYYAKEYDVIIDGSPSCFAKRAVLTADPFSLCADGNVSD